MCLCGRLLTKSSNISEKTGQTSISFCLRRTDHCPLNLEPFSTSSTPLLSPLESPNKEFLSNSPSSHMRMDHLVIVAKPCATDESYLVRSQPVRKVKDGLLTSTEEGEMLRETGPQGGEVPGKEQSELPRKGKQGWIPGGEGVREASALRTEGV